MTNLKFASRYLVSLPFEIRKTLSKRVLKNTKLSTHQLLPDFQFELRLTYYVSGFGEKLTLRKTVRHQFYFKALQIKDGKHRIDSTLGLRMRNVQANNDDSRSRQKRARPDRMNPMWA